MENTNNSAQTNAPEKKKSKKKWIIIAVIAVVLIIAIGSAGGDTGNDGPVVNSISDSGNSDTPSQTTPEETTAQPATSEIKAGSEITNNEFKISYKSCNADFKNYSKYATLADGYKVVEAVFDFENITDSDQSVGHFECYADGVKCDTFYSVDDYSNPDYESISAGRKLTDSKLYFTVPKDAEVIELEYEYNMWNEDKYIFVIE